MTELWDLYDAARNKTGETMRRGDEIPDGRYHMVIHVCVFNSKGELLIQQRQPFKHGWSNRWDLTVGGSAVAGDTSQMAAEREFLEELGYPLKIGDLRPKLTINFPQGFDDIYLLEQEIDLNELKLQYEEVQAVRWATEAEILCMIDSEEFVSYHKSMIQLLFELRGSAGGHAKEDSQ